MVVFTVFLYLKETGCIIFASDNSVVHNLDNIEKQKSGLTLEPHYDESIFEQIKALEL
jgi:hypothetical protein